MPEQTQTDQPATTEAKPATPPPKPDVPPVQTQHQMTVGRKKLNYTVTTGMMPLKTEAGETEARLFFMAYTLSKGETDPKRPVTFVFNGGPGSAPITPTG